MTRMLDRLEQKDLIVRRRCPDDRRQIRLGLSEEGQKLADRLPEIGAAAMNELLGVLDPVELTTLEAILSKVLLASGDTLAAMRLGAK